MWAASGSHLWPQGGPPFMVESANASRERFSQSLAPLFLIIARHRVSLVGWVRLRTRQFVYGQAGGSGPFENM